MNDKQLQLLNMLQDGALRVIPAASTAERNDLSDLVAQRTIPELKEVYGELDRPGRRAFVWLVCTVVNFDTAQEILYKTAVAHAFHQVMQDNADAIEEEWKPLLEARSIQYHAKQRLNKRRANILAQYRKLRRQRDRWRSDAEWRASEALRLNRQIEELERRLDMAQQRNIELETTLRVTIGIKQAA